jgi:hypothetical protein
MPQFETGGKVMQKQKPVRTTLYLPPTLWQQCKLLAVVRGRGATATDIVVTALEQYLSKVKRDAFEAKLEKFALAARKGGRS